MREVTNEFYKAVCPVLDKENSTYCKSLIKLAKANNLDILSYNDHKMICTEGLKYVLITYEHTKDGYRLTNEKEYFKNWEDFKKDYLGKLKG